MYRERIVNLKQASQYSHQQERREDDEEDVSRYCMPLRRKEDILEFERGSTRQHRLENSRWKSYVTVTRLTTK